MVKTSLPPKASKLSKLKPLKAKVPPKDILPEAVKSPSTFIPEAVIVKDPEEGTKTSDEAEKTFA